MDEIIQTLIEGLLQQKETLDLTIEELNSLESATEKDNKIVQDRIDKLVVDLDTLDKLIRQLEAKKPETIDLSPYATLDKLNEILDIIPNYEAIKADLIAFVDTLPKAKDGTNGIDGKDGINGVDGLNGKDGIDGANGKDGINGKDGLNGADGINGIGIKSIVYRDDMLIVTLTDGTVKSFSMPIQRGGGGLDDRVRIEVAKATQEPTGFDRLHPDTMGIIELSPDGINILRINQNSVFSSNSSGKFGLGTPYECDATPRTFAIYPIGKSFNVWVASVKYEITDIRKLQVSNETNHKIIYFDDTGTLREETNDIGGVFDYYSAVCSIYGNATTQQKLVFGDERHGIRMDGATHKYLHLTQGTKYVSGAQINGLTSGGTTYSTIDAGVFFDEDIALNHHAQTNSPFWYQDNTGWVISPDGVQLALMGTRTYYNQYLNNAWQLSQVASNEFCLIHFFATNDGQFPYVKVLGQKTYGNAKDAREGALLEIQNLSLDGLPSLEFKAIFTIILNSAGALTLDDNGDLYTDFRDKSTTGVGGSLSSEILTNPISTQVNQVYTRIDYDNGNYKLFGYTDGTLTTINLNNKKLKTLHYNGDGTWLKTVESQI